MKSKRELLPLLMLEKNNKISGGIYHKMQIDFAYNSNHIEGSHLSHEQTRYIFETHTVDGFIYVNDIFETSNHFKCFDYILETVAEPLTEDYIKNLHRMLKNGIMIEKNSDMIIGDYKKFPNEVGQITTAMPEDVHNLICELLSKYNNKSSVDLYDIAEFHAEFEKIHPFYDGNGRVGRLIMLKMCLENNIVPFFINEENKYFYYKGLKEWQVDEKPLRLLDVFLSMQDDMKAILDYFRIDYDKTDISSREIAEKHNCL